MSKNTDKLTGYSIIFKDKKVRKLFTLAVSYTDKNETWYRYLPTTGKLRIIKDTYDKRIFLLITSNACYKIKQQNVGKHSEVRITKSIKINDSNRT